MKKKCQKQSSFVTRLGQRIILGIAITLRPLSYVVSVKVLNNPELVSFKLPKKSSNVLQPHLILANIKQQHKPTSSDRFFSLDITNLK
jgi:hypothetical protein